jgi:hypothetical protein
MTVFEVYTLLSMMYNNSSTSENLNDAILEALDVAWVELTEEEKMFINNGKPVFDLE